MLQKTDIRDSDEKVVEIEMERLRTFTNHPYKVIGDSQMIELQDSIKKYAAERLGYKKIPVIIRMMQDDEAVVTMVDSNLQREQITPSEKAYAFSLGVICSLCKLESTIVTTASSSCIMRIMTGIFLYPSRSAAYFLILSCSSII